MFELIVIIIYLLVLNGNTFTDNNAQYGGTIAITVPVSGCINTINNNTFINNTGYYQTGGILIATSWIYTSDNYNMPINDGFNVTFYKELNGTNWIFNIYNNTFASNIGGHHGSAIIISPNDFSHKINSNNIANITTITNITINENVYENNYEINIFDNIKHINLFI